MELNLFLVKLSCGISPNKVSGERLETYSP